MSTQENVLHIYVQESLQCLMCRGAMRFVLGINTLHCSSHKTRRGLELPIRLFCFACYPISPVQKNVHRLWRGFHINRALEHSGEEGGGEYEKEKVMPRKLASFKSSAQKTSLNGQSAVPNPLCPHGRTPGDQKVNIQCVGINKGFTWPCLTIMPSVWDSWLLC